MRKDILYIFLFFFLSPFYTRAQKTHEIDSLEQLLPGASAEEKAKLFNAIGRRYLRIDAAKAFEYLSVSLRMADSLHLDQVKLHATDNLGIYYKDGGNYSEARKCFTDALSMAKSEGNKEDLGDIYQDYANFFRRTAVYDTALDYMLIALRIAEERNDKSDQVSINTNIGSLYVDREEYDKALKYYELSEKLSIEINDRKDLAGSIIGIGIVYGSRGEYEKAIGNFERALAICESIPDYTLMGNCYADLSMVYGLKNDFQRAVDYQLKMLQLKQKSGMRDQEADAWGNLTSLYLQLGQEAKALDALANCIRIAEEIKNKDTQRFSYQVAANFYSKTGDYKKAFEFQAKYIKVNKELNNEQRNKQAMELEAKYQSEKKQKELELNQEKLRTRDSEIRQQRIVNYSVIAGLVLISALAFFVFRGYRQKKKDGMLLGEQKAIIEEKNKSITDSINYAKRLQDAILPGDDFVYSYLKESFILYKPKDIVSGDLYWVMPAGNSVLFAVVDCTGHGVPGAMMSIVGHNVLNRALKEQKETVPGRVLDRMNEGVSETFRQQFGNTTVRDGMDVALCALDRNAMKLFFAGANNPVYILRNGQVSEIKGDKFPIGNYGEEQHSFATHEYDLQKGDRIYIFSDGYADQFGGPKGKKFKYQQLKECLVRISDRPMNEQKVELDRVFEEWKGELEQVDDVCMIGVKV